MTKKKAEYTVFLVVDSSNGKLMGLFHDQGEAQHRCDNTPAHAAIYEVTAKRVNE